MGGRQRTSIFFDVEKEAKESRGRRREERSRGKRRGR